jgi:hypothetical protein
MKSLWYINQGLYYAIKRIFINKSLYQNIYFELHLETKTPILVIYNFAEHTLFFNDNKDCVVCCRLYNYYEENNLEL